MSTTDFLIVYVAFLYLTLAAGIFAKFYIVGVRGNWLLYSFFAPITMLVLSPASAAISALRDDDSVGARISNAIRSFYFAYRYLPVFVGLTGKLIVDRCVIVKRRQKKRQTRNGFIRSILPSYDDYNEMLGLKGV